MKCTRVIAALVAVISLAGAALAQPQGAPGGSGGPPPMSPATKKLVEQAQAMGKEFEKSLTPDQKKKMQLIQETSVKKSQALIEPYKKKYGSKQPSPAEQQKIMKEIMPKLQKLQMEAESAAKKILNPKQQATLAKLMSMQKQIMAQIQKP
jgi:hypothetical protein